MSGRRRVIFAYVVLALLAVPALWFVDFSPIVSLSAPALLLIVPGSLIGLIVRAYVASIPLRTESIRPPIREWLGLGVYGFLADLVLPLKSGLALRAVYLKRRYNLSYSKFAGLQGGMNIFSLWTTAMIALFLALMNADKYAGLALPYAVAAGALLVPALSRPIARVRSGVIFERLAETYDSFQRLKTHPTVLARVLLATLVLLTANVCAMYYALKSFDSQAGICAAALCVMSIRLISLVSITPGNLGVQEFVAAIVLTHLGADFDDGVLASLIARAVGAVLLLASAPFFVGIFRDLKAVSNPQCFDGNELRQRTP